MIVIYQNLSYAVDLFKCFDFISYDIRLQYVISIYEYKLETRRYAVAL